MRLPAFARARLFALALFVALFVALVAPGCGRSSLELETPAEGGTPVGNCAPSNCPNGCCDAAGVCRIGSDTRACGSTAQRCSDCIANGFQFCDARKVCGRTVTSCGPTECPGGCCSFDGGSPKCLAGSDPNACGQSGAACIDCGAQGRSCDPLQRSCGLGKCDASNCNGCCVGDKCLSGTDGQACGANGQACESCNVMGQSCGNSPGGGGQCVGTPTCGPDNCGGCCNGKVCVAGSDSNACGKQGAACSNCVASGKECVAQGQPNERTCQAPLTCNAATCPGCCVGNNCVVATTPAACGKGGQVCQGCAANETCNAGVCTAAANCGPANCAGCCIGADVCAQGSQDTACGATGIQCLNCTGQGGKVCQGGSCQAAACGPANCAGCCSGNTCVLGTQDNACGTAGAACNDCTPGNQVCQGRTCQAKCGPATCAGCCTAANGCAVGTTAGACGSDGNACSNCAAGGSTCDTLVNPRACTNAQNQCPAAYPACPAATVTTAPPALQGVCDDLNDLDAIQAACSLPLPAGSPSSASCVAAFQTLALTNPACATCLAPFDVPFTQLKGIYACAAPFVSAACNHTTGCSGDCEDKACVQCAAGAIGDQCRASVNGGGGQCNTFVTQSVACLGVLPPGSLCRPGTYPNGNFGRWLRAVGDHFCGNGP